MVLAILVVPQGIMFPGVLASQPLVVSMALWPMAVLFLPLSDSFAGERERGTLEVLLLSPVPDWGIPAAKLVVLYLNGVVDLVFLLVVHMVTSLAAIHHIPPLAWYAEALSLGVALYPLIICLGLLVSWSASSVQAAQAITVYVPFGTLIVGGTLISKLAPLVHVSVSAPPVWTGRVSILCVAILSGVVCYTVLSRFRRHRLLLRCRQTFADVGPEQR